MSDNEYPQRIELDHVPFDHWDGQNYCHATGWEVRLGPDPSDWWYEYEDEKSGETFLAR